MDTNKRTTRTRTQLSTFGTDLGSIVRLDFKKFNSLSFSFILDKTLQLKETPIANPIIHSPSEISFSNSFEVFHNNLASIKTANNTLADVMIYPSHKMFLFSRNLFQKSSGTSSSFSLEFTSQEFEFPFNLLNLRGVKELSVRSNSKIVYAEVDAKNSVRTRTFDINLFSECEQEEASAFGINSQKAFINFPTEIIFETIRDSEWNFNSSFNCRDTQDIIFEREASRRVISEGTEINKGFSLGFFNHSTSLFNTSNRQLSRKSKSFQFLINKGMEFDIVPNFHFPSLINTELQTSFVDNNSINNLLSWFNSNLSSCSSSHRYLTNLNYLNLMDSPPKAEAMGIRDARFI